MKTRIRLFMLSSLALLLIIVVLPFFSAEGYSIIHNTTSELGAQKTPNAWIMNLSFILTGLSCLFAGWPHYADYWFQRIVLLIFCCSLILTALFHHAPIDPGLNFNAKENSLHSLFSSLTGFSFTLLAISTGFLKGKTAQRLLPIALGLLATLLSLLMFTVEEFRGLFQRLIFILAFGWMLWEFRKS